MKKTRQVVIQPSSFCNIDCRYCYVTNRSDKTIISPEVRDDILHKTFKSSRLADGFRLVWHNGEPLTLGIEFYKSALEAIARYNVNRIDFFHAIQTNATLIDQRWAEFFLSSGIHPSISLDGPKHIHDHNRISRTGLGTFERVMRGVKILRDNRIKLMALCVVTEKSLDHGKELVEFFVKEGFESLGLIVEEPWGQNSTTSFAVPRSGVDGPSTENRFKSFINEVYEAWYPSRKRLNIREFSDTFTILANAKIDPHDVIRSEDNSPCTVISFSRTGDITTFSPQMITGIPGDPRKFVVANVADVNSLDDLDSLERQQDLAEQIAEGVNRCKQECGYFNMCGGGIPASKYYEHGTFNCTETAECRYSRQLLLETLIEKIGGGNES